MDNSIDLTKGSLAKNIILFSLPLTATAVLQQLFNSADVAVVGRFCGTNAMAAVGSNAPIVGLMVNLFVGIALGANVCIAQAMGRKSLKEVFKAEQIAIIIALIGGIVMSLLFEFFASTILSITGVPTDVLPMATLYLKIYAAGLPAIFLYNYLSAIFRGRGNSKTPLIVLVISGITNVALNLFFVLVMNMTVEGVAIATALSNLLSTVILLTILLTEKSELRLNFKNLEIDKSIISKIIKIGLPSGIQSSMFSIANIVVQSGINSLGPKTMAGSTAAFNIEILVYFMMNSFSQACTTVVGQNFGAKNYKRCRDTLKISLILAYITTMGSAVIFFFFGKQILSLFNTDPEVISIGVVRMTFIFAAYTMSVCQEIGSGYFRGYGHSVLPAVWTLVCVFFVRILWVSFVFPLFKTFVSVMIVYPVTLGCAGLGIILSILIIRPSRRYVQGRE